MAFSSRIVTSCYLALTAGLVTAYYLNPQQRIVWWTALGLAGVVAIVVGTRLHRPAHPQYWYVLAAANLSFTIGEVVQVVYTQYLNNQSYPSLADGFYLAEYALYAVGVAGFIRWRTARQDRSSVIDALILTLGLGMLIWLYLIVPNEQVPGVSTLARAVSIAYPLGDVLILAMLMRLLAPHGGKSSALWLLTAGSLGLLAADTLYGLIQLHGTWQIGTPVDLGWAAFYCLWGAAALHPSMVELTQPIPIQPVDISTGRLVLLAAVSLIAPAVMVSDYLNGRTGLTWIVGLFSAALFLLVIARLSGIVRVHRQAVARERALRIAGASFTSALTFADVTETVTVAAAMLMKSSPRHAVLLAVRTDGTLRIQGDAPCPPLRIPAEGELESSLLVTAEELGGEPQKRLDGLPHALLCPLALRRRSLGEPLIGVLVIGGPEHELASLWGNLDLLAAQSALAVERVMLDQEVTRHKNEVYFRTLVQNASDVIMILDEADTIRYATPSAQRVLGHPDLAGTVLGELVVLEDQRTVQEDLARVRAGAEHRQRCRHHWQLLRALNGTIEVEVYWNDLREDPTVGGLVLTLRDVTEQMQLERELTHRAFHDSLTGLANRVLFQDRVNHALTHGGRRGTVIGVLFIDLDDFKVVNDTQGHPVGDELLIAVSLRICAALRSSDTAARLGGDEFAVLVEDALTPADVGATAEAVLRAFDKPFPLSFGTTRVTASIGVATTEDSVDSAELLAHADLAVYSAKAAGKRQWHRYQEHLQTGLRERHELNASLDTAIAESAFALHYQPIVDLVTGDLTGFEALIRWPHEQRGMVLPEEFISLAEESGQIIPLGTWVLHHAVAQAAQWQQMAGKAGNGAALRPPRMSVNVSARQFRDPGFVDLVREAIDSAGLAPDLLVVELTETVLMRLDDQVRTDMRLLSELGVRLAIDDFGTGYSSLSYLRDFPISILKIDKSFVDGLGLSEQQYALVEGIARIADTLGVIVVAEGIENAVQRRLLTDMGCPLGQGYLFAPPLTGSQAEAYIHRMAATPAAD